MVIYYFMVMYLIIFNLVFICSYEVLRPSEQQTYYNISLYGTLIWSLLIIDIIVKSQLAST